MSGPLTKRIATRKEAKRKYLREIHLQNLHRELLDKMKGRVYTPEYRTREKELFMSEIELTEAEYEELERQAEAKERIRITDSVAHQGYAYIPVNQFQEDTVSRQQDLKGNFLYAKYIEQMLGWENPIQDFRKYCEWMGARSFLRMVTRQRNHQKLAKELTATEVDVAQAREFVFMERHKNPDRVEMLRDFYAEVPRGKRIVEKMLVMYANAVQSQWDTMKISAESPLPTQPDWLLMDAPAKTRLEEAVDDYLAGMSLKEAASKNKVHQRTLRNTLALQGVEMKRGRPKHDGTSTQESNQSGI